MARISRFKLDDNKLKKLFILFFEVVGKKNNIEEFNNTIIDLLSPTERIMISKRIAIIYLLMKNIDHHTVCKVLKVSSATVAKFNLLMEKSSGVVPTFKKILVNEKISQFLEELFMTLFAPGTPGVDWRAAWQHRRDFEKRKSEGF